MKVGGASSLVRSSGSPTGCEFYWRAGGGRVRSKKSNIQNWCVWFDFDVGPRHSRESLCVGRWSPRLLQTRWAVKPQPGSEESLGSADTQVLTWGSSACRRVQSVKKPGGPASCSRSDCKVFIATTFFPLSGETSCFKCWKGRRCLLIFNEKPLKKRGRLYFSIVSCQNKSLIFG